jgi:Sec-independent protein secretion pathway component TatC
MLAFPLWLLYEIGIVAAGMLIKPERAQNDTQARSDSETERESNKIDAGQKKD